MAMLSDGSHPPSFTPAKQSFFFPAYMLGAQDAEHSPPLRSRRLSQSNAEHWTVCESTALPAEGDYHSVKCELLPICKLQKVLTGNTVMTENLTPSRSTANATNQSAVYTRSDTPPSTQKSMEPFRVDDGLPIEPKKTVQFAYPDSTVIQNTDPTDEQVTACRTPHALQTHKTPLEYPIPSASTMEISAPSIDSRNLSPNDNNIPKTSQ